MTLPPFWWQGHNSCGKVISKCGKDIPSPENCHGVNNDLTHQNNVFAIGKNDLATILVARSKFVWQGH